MKRSRMASSPLVRHSASAARAGSPGAPVANAPCTPLPSRAPRRLGPYHAILWRHGEKGRPKVQPERREVIDDTALSRIMANLHLLGAPAAEGGFDDEQLMPWRTR